MASGFVPGVNTPNLTLHSIGDTAVLSNGLSGTVVATPLLNAGGSPNSDGGEPMYVITLLGRNTPVRAVEVVA
jgi:hypothetical protein